MVLGIIADTHDAIGTTSAAFSLFRFRAVDAVIHCGDWKSVTTLQAINDLALRYNIPVRGVLGNNDREVEAFIEAGKSASHVTISEGIDEVVFGTARCAIYHGHHRPTLTRLRASSDYDIVFLGHTHKPLIEHEGSTLFVNPGSVAFSIPRSKTWLPTIAIVDTETRQATIETVPLP